MKMIVKVVKVEDDLIGTSVIRRWWWREVISIRLRRREVLMSSSVWALSYPDMRGVVGMDITTSSLLKHVLNKMLNMRERPFLDPAKGT